ncbi:LysR family transcriptional regulator [Granulosicoccaceae sp. 1_MG-2023]|nr:LysR family transcriptional regulator [Granulosicoccaceae sp. 1_MG-2023]
MNFKRLQYFVCLAQTGNFTRAAATLGIAQSALSMAIRRLEEETGLYLVNRAERRVSLTADGEALFAHAERILASVGEAQKALAERRDLDSGLVCFGASSMISSYLLPPVLTAFKQRYPGISVRLVEAGTDTLSQMLIDGELELALVRADQLHEQLRCQPLFVEEVVACLPASHRLAAKPHLAVGEFCAEPLVLTREGYFLREALKGRLAPDAVLDVRFETNLTELMKKLVLAGVGISTCLPMIVRDEPGLVARSFSPPIPLPMGLGRKRNHHLSRAAATFSRFLEEQVPGLYP